MDRVAEFEKVSFDEFYQAMKNFIEETGLHVNTNVTEEFVKKSINIIYDQIELPKRATSGSAGYDFYSPVDFVLAPQQTIKIPTGIRVKIDNGWFGCCVPRSSLGFKYRLQLDNTVGIIDSDYYHSDNEGHIYLKVTNDSNSDRVLDIMPGDKIMQMIFMPYGITYSDNEEGVRNGGIGSTGE